ncbi:MAG: hypothetical protein ACRDRU_08170, partial [Pseudonocardiaceae bacterium]
DLVRIARTTLRDKLIEHLKAQHGEAAVRDSIWPREWRNTTDLYLPESGVREFDYLTEGRTPRVSDQPRTRYPIQVSVPGTRTDTGTACTLLAIREPPARG